MNIKVKLLSLAIIVAFSACKNGRKHGAQSEYEDVSSDKANLIIQYNNVLVEFTDHKSSYVKGLEYHLETIKKDLDRPKDQFSFIGLTSDIDIPDYSLSSIKPENPPSALSRDDRNFFKENVAVLNSTVKNIKATNKELYEYINAEDFKDDNSVKGKKLVDSIYALSDKFYAYDTKIMARLVVIADGAERVVMESHPLKEYIFAMKDDQKETQAFYDFISKNAKDYRKVEPKVKILYQSMEKNKKVHAGMDAISEYKFSGKQRSFAYFYDAYNNYLICARKLMRDASPYGAVSKWQLEELYDKGESMRHSYNSFVQ